MSAPLLFGRKARVTVGTLLLEGPDGKALDVSFKVKRNLKPEPNTCDLKIWGLSRTSRHSLEASTVPAATPSALQKVVPVKIEAGYQGALSQIFLGELRAAQTTVDGPEVITEISTGDGDKAVKLARVNLAFGPGTTSETAMRQLLKTLGIGSGNLPKALTLLKSSGLAQIYAKGAVLKGSAAEHMTDLCRSAGLEWSVSEGQLQVLALNQPLDGQAIKISPDTGLVDSPSVDTKGVLSFTTLMIPGLKPGVKVDVESAGVKGGYRVISTEHTGSTFETEWFIKAECQRY